MPGNSNKDTDRTTIVKLRVLVTQLEAKLAKAEQDQEIDMSGLSLDKRLEKYAPTPDEYEDLQAEFLCGLIHFGVNRGVLDKQGLINLLGREKYKESASRLQIDGELALVWAQNLLDDHNGDLSAIMDGEKDEKKDPS